MSKCKRCARESKTVSQWMLFAVCFTYFAGVALGCFVTVHILIQFPEYAIQAFMSLLAFIGSATGIAIGFYSWKAKNENMAKIRCSSHKPDAGVDLFKGDKL